MRSEIVKGVLSNIMPSGLGGLSSELPEMSKIRLSLFHRSIAVNDITINTEVWYSVVDWVTEWSLLVLILGASRR